MQITKEIIKIFADWTKIKIRLHISEKQISFKEQQIWWASLGQNIGVEANGKNMKFERPVIILRKFNKKSFWGIPISSQRKIGIHYFEIKDDAGISSFANLSQIRLMSSNRLIREIGELRPDEFREIKARVKSLI